MNPRSNYLKQEGFDLMGAAFEVYNQQGHGIAEEIYQESLEIELELRSIPYSSKIELKTYYKDRLLKKSYIPDLLTHNKIIVELKSLSELTTDHEAQLLNYMRLSKQPIGYLINFGKEGGAQWKRFILDEYISDPNNPKIISEN